MISLLSVLLGALFATATAITVHLVPHSHDDVGWLKTVDEYFVGINNNIQHAAVQYILDNVIEQLQRNPERTFNFVEQAFFQRWWAQQDDEMRTVVRRLVANKQLEFLNGGWCMHDESTTSYIDMIDQTTLGHSYILNEFGSEALPQIGWQLDPFGHSSTQASLMAGEIGFKGLFFGRIDHIDHDRRMNTQDMSFVWRPSASRQGAGSIFSMAFPDGNYGPPGDLCFDTFCSDDPVQADPRLNGYNLPEKVALFNQRAQEFADLELGETATKNVMFMLGSDFQWENAREWYKQLDVLIRAVNANGTVRAMYSSPRRYLDAKNRENITLSVKTDDFFPYSDDYHQYWTGYFSSRPALKRYIRLSSAALQVSRHFEVFAGGNGTKTQLYWENIAVAQHHDAVAGTEKQAVAFDYAQRIHRGSIAADETVQSGIGKFVNQSSSEAAYASCPLANITVCPASASGNVVVTLYNPLLHARSEIISIPSASDNVKVVDETGSALPFQVLPSFKNEASESESLPFRVFVQAQMPALGIRSFFLLRSASFAPQSVMQLKPIAPSSPRLRRHQKVQAMVAAPISIENKLIRVTFDDTNKISFITDLVTNQTTPFTQSFAWYPSHVTPNGCRRDCYNSGGAYVFRSAQNYSNPLGSAVTIVAHVDSALVSEVWQQFTPWVTQIVRLKADSTVLEFEWTVGSVPIDDNVGKEIVAQYNASIASASTFYTDSNGREMQRRTRFSRPSWEYINDEPISGNFYPCNAFSYLADSKSALSVHVDRSQAVSSTADGELEFLIHRRLLADDGKGVNEHLNETRADGTGLVITGTHFVSLAAPQAALAQNRQLQNIVYSPLHVSYAPFNGDVKSYVSTHRTAIALSNSSLPVQVELVTLQVMPNTYVSGAGAVLMRFAHLYESSDPSPYSDSATFDLASVTMLTIKSVRELSLTATQPIAAVARNQLQWKTSSDTNGAAKPSTPLKGTVVTLEPMQIRTFAVEFA